MEVFVAQKSFDNGEGQMDIARRFQASDATTPITKGLKRLGFKTGEGEGLTRQNC